MTLRECYEMMHGDYEGVTGRLVSESLVRKFAVKFLNDPSFGELRSAIESGDGETAFRASHTLKGICLDLGFSALYEASSALTEKLRGNNSLDDECKALFNRVHEVTVRYRRSKVSIRSRQ